MLSTDLKAYSFGCSKFVCNLSLWRQLEGRGLSTCRWWLCLLIIEDCRHWIELLSGWRLVAFCQWRLIVRFGTRPNLLKFTGLFCLRARSDWGSRERMKSWFWLGLVGSLCRVQNFMGQIMIWDSKGKWFRRAVLKEKDRCYRELDHRFQRRTFQVFGRRQTLNIWEWGWDWRKFRFIWVCRWRSWEASCFWRTNSECRSQGGRVAWGQLRWADQRKFWFSCSRNSRRLGSGRRVCRLRSCRFV